MSGFSLIFIAASEISHDANLSVTAEHQIEKPRVTNIQEIKTKIDKIVEITASMNADRKELIIIMEKEK